MQNSKTIPAGATVYYCRSGLGFDFTSLMTVQTAVIQKRTPTGYKIESHYNRLGWLLSDSEYYVSENRKEVVDAVLHDISVATEKAYSYITELEKAADKL